MPSPPLLARTLSALVVALVCLLVYFPGLSGGFLFDDFPNIVTNTRVHAESLDAESLSRAAAGYEPGAYGRPIATIGFAFDYYLGGKNPWGYKLHSLIVHLVNALLVLALVRTLLSLPRAGGGWPRWTPAAIALAWAIHPLQASTVLYIVQRMEMLAVTFVLLALLAYLRGRIRQRDGQSGAAWLVTSAVLAGLGMLAKETAVLFPVYALALELTLLRFEASEPRTRRFLQRAYAAGVVIALLAFSLWLVPRYATPEAYAHRDFTLYERLLTQLRVLPMYLGQILLPLPSQMPFYYDAYPKSTGWLSPATTLAGGLAILALLAAAWRLNRHLPLATLGILWFFAAHLLSSTVINLELVFEHRNYFALLGILVTLAVLLRRIPTSDQAAARLATGALVIGLAALCAIRAATWGDPLVLAADLVARAPLSPRASSDLATLYVALSDSNPDSPFFDFGRKEFERGSRLPNASPLPEQGLILMAATTGQPVLDEWWRRMILKLETRPIGTQESLAVMGLVRQRMAGISLDDAKLADTYKTLARHSTQPPAIYALLGDHAANRLRDNDLAQSLFLDAIDGSRSDPAFVRRIIETLIQEGHVDLAQAAIARAESLGIALPPDERAPK